MEVTGAVARSHGELDELLAEIRACRVCAEHLPHGPRPVIQAAATARLAICGQAPGTKVHESGVPFTDRSGDRLRSWLGLDHETFYDAARIAIVPMGFCFPGQDAKGGDKPPRKECAPLWRARVFERLPAIRLTLLIGQYAQRWHLGPARRESLTATVQAWREFGPAVMPLPHPSWRNTHWLKANPWFEGDLLPVLRARVLEVLAA